MEKEGEGQIETEVAAQLQQLREKFEAAMNDDLNTAVAASVIFELARLASQSLATTTQTLRAIDDLFTQLGGHVLGIVKHEYEKQTTTEAMQRLEQALGVAIELRNEARREKDYQRADKIRESLAFCGIALEDTSKGTEWRFT